MPRVFWVNTLQRLVILLGLLTLAAFALLMGRPSFTNASKPPRFGGAMFRTSTGSWAMRRARIAK
jgi:hypothetical protein